MTDEQVAVSGAGTAIPDDTHIHQSFVDGCYSCELRAENERLKQALAQTTGVAVSLGTGTVAAQRAYEENRTALLEVSVENERLRAQLRTHDEVARAAIAGSEKEIRRLRAEADRMEILRGKEIIRLRAALEHMVDVFGPLGRMGAGGPALDEARAALGRDKDG